LIGSQVNVGARKDVASSVELQKALRSPIRAWFAADSDAPVVTMEQTEGNRLYFGIGFGRPNVEVFLPVSPTACIHVLPLVTCTRHFLIDSGGPWIEAENATRFSLD
jgi:hypothetical protein